MGNTDKFEMIADKYDTSERIQIAKEGNGSCLEKIDVITKLRRIS